MSWKIIDWNNGCSDKAGNECTHPARRRMACCESDCPKKIDDELLEMLDDDFEIPF